VCDDGSGNAAEEVPHDAAAAAEQKQRLLELALDGLRYQAQ
jgi:hypothetical protein